MTELRFKREKLLSIELRQNYYGDRFLNLLVKFVSPSSNTVKLVSLILLFLFGGQSLVSCHYNPFLHLGTVKVIDGNCVTNFHLYVVTTVILPLVILLPLNLFSREIAAY